MNLLSKIRNTKIYLGVLRHQTGRGFVHSGKALNTHASQFKHTATDINTETRPIEADAIGSGDDGYVIENPHPEKAAIPNRKPPRGIKRIYFTIRSNLVFIHKVIFPKPSPEELEKRVQSKKDRIIIKAILMDAKRASRIMSNRFKELMFYQKIVEGAGKPAKIKKVRFDVIAYDWDETTHTGGNQILFHIDTYPGHLPDGVRLTELLSQESMNEIQYSMDHPVRGWANIEGGIIKLHRSMNNGITSFVSIQDMWNAMPDNLPLLAFPVGIGENARHFHKDLDDCPHLLVVGATKQGKSNMINGILCTYLERGLKPSQVQFVLFDCKAGLEFSFFDGIPHLFKDRTIQTGIIEELDQAVPAMEHLIQVMGDRMDMIRKAGCKSVNDYNMAHRGDKRIPALIICFDDYISLSLMYGKKADNVLTVLSSQGRAAGIYIILGAQYPKSDQFPSIALVNFPVVIAFRLKSGASRSILNSQAAVELSCRGRAIFQDFDEESEVQTPRIPDSIIRACVEGAKTGKKPLRASKIDIEEILGYALEHMEGRLDVHKLFDKFRGKISRNKLQAMLMDADEQVYNVSGTLYLVTMKEGYPRRMKLASDENDLLSTPSLPEQIP
jgi:hypothetical protein